MTNNSNGSINSFARLLATENIGVEHQYVATASFDTAARTLTLPIWTGMSADLYDMLVGHEVGHALWTPQSWEVISDAIERLCKLGLSAGRAKSMLNIVEDVRIERLIKNKFPGIRRNFSIGYTEVLERDLFGIKLNYNGDMNMMPFMDRFNVATKAGAAMIEIPQFSAAEKVLVDQSHKTETFEDVVLLCCKIVEFLKSNAKSSPSDNGAKTQSSNGKGDKPESGESNTAGGSESGGGDEQSAAGAGDGEGEEKDTDNTEKTKQTGAISGEHIRNKGKEIGESFTDECMSDGLAKHAAQSKNKNKKYEYAPVPTFDLSEIVITSENLILKMNQKLNLNPKARTLATTLAEKWTALNRGTILNMVKRFEQRKAADIQSRTLITKSGLLDLSKIAYYRTNDDIFKNHITVSEGKNHGLVILIDWSGSMSAILGAVISQALCLVEFCRKTGVPYEIYAFTDNCYGMNNGPDTDPVHHTLDQEPAQFKTISARNFSMIQLLRSGLSRSDHAALVNMMLLLMASAGYKPFNDQIGAMIAAESAAKAGLECHSATSWKRPFHQLTCTAAGGDFEFPACLELSGTPLNEGIMCTAQLVERFQARTGVQIMNVAILTDGDATRSIQIDHPKSATPTSRYGESIVMTHGGKSYNTFRPENDTMSPYVSHTKLGTNACISYLKDRTGAAVYGFYLSTGNGNNNHRSITRELSRAIDRIPLIEEIHEYITTGAIICTHPAYDEYYIVQIACRDDQFANVDSLFNDLDDLRQDGSAIDQKKQATLVRKAFMKGMSNENSSRIICSRFADCFAIGRPSGRRAKVVTVSDKSWQEINTIRQEILATARLIPTNQEIIDTADDEEIVDIAYDEAFDRLYNQAHPT